MLKYTREIEVWEEYFEEIPADYIKNKCLWLNDFYNCYINEDYSNLYKHLNVPLSPKKEKKILLKESPKNQSNKQLSNGEEIKQKEIIPEDANKTKINSEPLDNKGTIRVSLSKVGENYVDKEKEVIIIDGNEYEKCSVTKFGKDGWYKTNDGNLSYLLVKNNNPKAIVGPLEPPTLRNLIEQAREKGFLIACPGTIQGQNGYYVNKKATVSRWEIKDNEWKKIKLTI